MKLMKQISLVVLMSLGATSVTQSVYAADATGSMFGFKALTESIQNFKFEVQPYDIVGLIRKYPVTAVAITILCAIGYKKLDRYWYYDLSNKIGDIRKAIDEELEAKNMVKTTHNPAPTPKKAFLLNPTHCCNPLHYIYFMKSKVSLAELVGGTRLVKLIERFYEAKQNWDATSTQTVGSPFEYKEKITKFLDGNNYVD